MKPQKFLIRTTASHRHQTETADYIAEMTVELVIMAKSVNLPLVAHLLAMAQAEAEYAAEQVI